ncbi:hypothetical protein [Noviherbaspirillum denitrificans]|uniref:Uncharacterized protein n=1 Tax=Noviherbaspirillum denitrificans TaxID=1968433 RepID=A0A254TG57_9BURK|nr:hypothetical protein [Noviherbaspirillum denitrificans]OWW19513.1 hypothetical protein AYR66_08295 [Noviherbaspirillum denitrificans]
MLPSLERWTGTDLLFALHRETLEEAEMESAARFDNPAADVYGNSQINPQQTEGYMPEMVLTMKYVALKMQVPARNSIR